MKKIFVHYLSTVWYLKKKKIHMIRMSYYVRLGMMITWRTHKKCDMLLSFGVCNSWAGTTAREDVMLFWSMSSQCLCLLVIGVHTCGIVNPVHQWRCHNSGLGTHTMENLMWYHKITGSIPTNSTHSTLLQSIATIKLLQEPRPSSFMDTILQKSTR